MVTSPPAPVGADTRAVRWRSRPDTRAVRWRSRPDTRAVRWRSRLDSRTWRAALARPSLLVVATVLLVTPPSGVEDVSTSGHVTPADLAAGVVILAIVIRLFAGDRISTRRGWLPFAAAVVSFTFATVTAIDVSVSARGFIRYSELFVLVPVAVAMTLRDRWDVLMVAGALVAVTVFEGVLGVLQYLTKTGASYGGQYVRAVGTFGADQVEALGALLGYGILITLALGLATRGRPRIALVAMAALLTVPLYLTLSRGAWIATAGALLLMLVIVNWRAALALTCTAVLAIAVMSLGGNGSDSAFSERLTSIVSSGSAPDRSVRDRYALWSTALAMWADHPILGVGMKDFAQYRDRYASMSLSAGSDVADRAGGFRREPLLSPHNQYLMVASEQGAVGILTFGGLLGTLAVGSVRRRRGTGGGIDAPDQGDAPDKGDGPAPVAARFLDFAAPAIMSWTLIDFMYGDVGAGSTSVLLGVLLGLAARRMVIVPEVGPVRPDGSPS